MKQTKIILVLVLISVICAVSLQNYNVSIKNSILENALAQKNLEYIWLKEITDSLLYNNGNESQQQFEKIKEYRDKHPQV